MESFNAGGEYSDIPNSLFVIWTKLLCIFEAKSTSTVYRLGETTAKLDLLVSAIAL